MISRHEGAHAVAAVEFNVPRVSVIVGRDCDDEFYGSVEVNETPHPAYVAAINDKSEYNPQQWPADVDQWIDRLAIRCLAGATAEQIIGGFWPWPSCVEDMMVLFGPLEALIGREEFTEWSGHMPFTNAVRGRWGAVTACLLLHAWQWLEAIADAVLKEGILGGEDVRAWRPEVSKSCRCLTDQSRRLACPKRRFLEQVLICQQRPTNQSGLLAGFAMSCNQARTVCA